MWRAFRSIASTVCWRQFDTRRMLRISCLGMQKRWHLAGFLRPLLRYERGLSVSFLVYTATDLAFCTLFQQIVSSTSAVGGVHENTPWSEGIWLNPKLPPKPCMYLFPLVPSLVRSRLCRGRFATDGSTSFEPRERPRAWRSLSEISQVVDRDLTKVRINRGRSGADPLRARAAPL